MTRPIPDHRPSWNTTTTRTSSPTIKHRHQCPPPSPLSLPKSNHAAATTQPSLIGSKYLQKAHNCHPSRDFGKLRLATSREFVCPTASIMYYPSTTAPLCFKPPHQPQHTSSKIDDMVCLLE
ncbi:hypothetical protein RJT34_11169 [Clitoria ternatea]|uniref:Uncharacterized protein n=1 Tax=Clitoria ternatea TaxID=43366 RepID=A0AAN9JLF5_CLITE